MTTARAAVSEISGAFTEAEVRAQLRTIQHDALFINSPRLSRLLCYLVDHSLGGEPRELREYAIGVEVFDRGPEFDPQSDTIVRVTARRLRKRLEEYYAASGIADAVRLEIPKGHYRVEFRWAAQPGKQGWPEMVQTRRQTAWAALAGIALVLGVSLAGVYYRLSGAEHPGQPGPGARATAEVHLLTGKHLFSRRSPGDVRASLAEFEKAVALDPTLVPAWVGMAGSLKILFFQGDVELSASLREQRNALSAALAVDPAHAEANIRMVFVMSLLGEKAMARKHLSVALRNGEDSMLVQSMAAGWAQDRGDLEDAIRLQRRAVALDPLSTVNHANLGQFLLRAGRLSEALERFRHARLLSTGPSAEPAASVDYDIALTLILLERFKEAEVAMRRLPPGPEALQVAAMLNHALGLEDPAQEALAQLAQKRDGDTVAKLAEVYAFRGEAAFALESARLSHRLNLEKWGDIQRVVRMSNNYLSDSPFMARLEHEPEWLAWSQEQQLMRMAVLNPSSE